MPGLVQRYNASAEHSALLSTAPTTRRRTHPSSHDNWHSTAQAVLSDEASSWFYAICPPLEDTQAVIRRFHSDPELSQKRVFGFLYPLVIFGSLFALCVIALQPNSFAHHIISCPSEHVKELAVGALALLAGLAVELVIIRGVIWGVANIASVIMEIEAPRQSARRGNYQELPRAGVLLGGAFM